MGDVLGHWALHHNKKAIFAFCPHQTFMKKAFCLALFLQLSFAALSQFYTSAGIGYGFAFDPFNRSKNTNTLYKSLGKGALPQIYLGYFIAEKSAALELDIQYLSGSKIETALITPTYKTYLTSQAQMFRLIPSCRLEAGDTLKLYAKFGPVLGMGTTLKERESIDDMVHSPSKYVHQYSKGIAYGFSVSLGARYCFTEIISLYAAAGFVGQRWAPKRSVATEFVYQGDDLYPTLTTSEKEVEYVRDPVASAFTDSPRQEARIYRSFNSWFLQSGIQFSF